MRTHRASSHDLLHRWTALLTAAVFTSAGTASPEGGVFLHGDGTITLGPNAQIGLDGPGRFVIGWNDFDLTSTESVVFNGVDFTVLNTINAAAPATAWTIDGTISAPGGDVWFVNPAGVMFTQNAVLDVGGVLAAAGSIDTADFIAGNDIFNLSGTVLFQGQMLHSTGIADRAIFLGHNVVNTGLISANTIALASGSTIRLIDLGTRISLEIDNTPLDVMTAAGGAEASMDGAAFVTNHGRLETAAQGQVLLASGDTLGAVLDWGGLAIEHDGEISSAGGQVEFVALDGAIRTDQHVDGGNAFVSSAGLIDTSSQDGGGTIAIAGPSVVIGSALRSQGGLNGGGGDIAIRGMHNVTLAGSALAGWDDAGNGHTGTGSLSTIGGGGAHDGGSILIDALNGRAVSASTAALTSLGGISGGSGGDIVVQADQLQWNARARASAVNGEAGSVNYFSDQALAIVADGSISDIDFNDLFDGGAGQSFLGASLPQSLGLVDCDLSVATNGRLTFETSIGGLPFGDTPSRLYADASFTAADIQFADASGVTELWAGGALSMNGPLELVDSDAVLIAGQRDGVSGLHIGGDISAAGTYRGDLVIDSPGALEIGGDIGLEGAQIGSLVLRSAGSLNFIDGDRAIRALRDVTLASLDGSALDMRMDGDLLVEAGEDMLFGDGLTIDGSASLTVNAGGTLTNRAIGEVAGDLAFSGGSIDNDRALWASGDLTVVSTNGDLVSVDALTAGGTLHLQASGNLDVTAPLTANGSRGSEAVVVVQAGGAMTLSSTITGESMSIAAGTELTLDGAVLTATGNELLSGDTLELAAPVMHVVGDSTIVAVNGQMTVHGGLVDGTFAVADMSLEGGSLTATTEQGALRFLATVDGANDLTLTSEQAQLYVGGSLGADTALQSIELEGAQALVFGGDIPLTDQHLDVFTIAATEDVLLQPSHSTEIVDGVASIQGFSSSLDITAGGDIRVGHNQSLVQLGDLSMTAGGTIEVTDITTQGDLTLEGAELAVFHREPMQILLADGSSIESPQASIVAGGDLLVQADTITAGSGTGEGPLFGALGSVTGVDEASVVTPSHFDRDDLVMDSPADSTQLLLRWLQFTDPNDVIASESQSAPIEPNIVRVDPNEDPFSSDALAELGIVVTPLESEHSDAARLARPGEVTVDLASGPGPAQVGRVVVTRHRLQRQQVKAAVANWQAAWGDQTPAEMLAGDQQPDASTLNRVQLDITSTYRHLTLAGLTASELKASRQFVRDSLLLQGATVQTVDSLLR